jgi:hypothetical protein
MWSMDEEPRGTGVTTKYARVEFREVKPGVEPWRPGWQEAVSVVGPTVRGWLDHLEGAPFGAAIEDDNGRYWHVTGKSVDGGLEYRVEMPGYLWFFSARAELAPKNERDKAH